MYKFCWWECKVFGKSLPIYNKQHLSLWSSKFTSKFLSKRNANISTTYFHRNVPDSFIYNSHKLETMEVHSDRKTNIVVFSYSGIIIRHKTTITNMINIINNTKESHRHYAEQWQTQEYIFDDTIKKKFYQSQKQSTEKNIRIEVALGKGNILYCDRGVDLFVRIYS